jgi:chemotaxis protein MotB
MGRNQKQAESDEAPGAPEWMVTFSDCMTLLLTFFVLLLSFSSFDNRVFRKLKVIYSSGLTTIIPSIRSDRDALNYVPPVEALDEFEKGSEKPTLSEGKKDGLIKDSGPLDFNKGVVFVFPSDNLFWGKGIAISTDGRKIMDNISIFLSEIPNRIVISENGTQEPTADSLGLQRAWAVMNYLTTKQNLDKKRFSITSVSTLARENDDDAPGNSARANSDRILEILLLSQNTYN